MNRLRLIRLTCASIGALAGVALVAELTSVSALAAITCALCLVMMGVTYASFELSLRAEARRRAVLQRHNEKLASKLGRLEPKDTASPIDRYMTPEERSPLAAYRHQATLLHRLGAVERALGLGPVPPSQSESNEEDEPAR